jgi:hypothetical protein
VETGHSVGAAGKVSGEAASACSNSHLHRRVEDSDFPPALVFSVDQKGLCWENCDILDLLIEDRNEIAVLDSVDPVGVTEVLESHSQPLSSEELYDLAQQLTVQQKEDEDRATKQMQTQYRIDISSPTDMAAEQLCDNERE